MNPRCIIISRQAFEDEGKLPKNSFVSGTWHRVCSSVFRMPMERNWYIMYDLLICVIDWRVSRRHLLYLNIFKPHFLSRSAVSLLRNTLSTCTHRNPLHFSKRLPRFVMLWQRKHQHKHSV